MLRKDRKTLLRLKALRRTARTDPFAHVRLSGEIVESEMGIPDTAFGWIGDAAVRSAAVQTVRQQLIARLMYANYLPELLTVSATDGVRAVLSMPPMWRRACRARGVQIASWRSRVAWWRAQAGFLRSGIGVGLRIFRTALRGGQSSFSGDLGILVSVPGKGLPRKESVLPADDFATWCRTQLPGDMRTQTTWVVMPDGMPANDVHLPDDLHVVRLPVPVRGGRASARAIAFDTAMLAARAIAGLVTGAWWNVILLPDAVWYAHARRLDDTLLPRVVLFNNSHWAHRPLWTYHAAQRGACVAMVFYATNTQLFSRANGAESGYFPGYRTMSWDRYLVWDAYQRAFVTGAVGTGAPVDIVGPVGFVDSGDLPANLPERYIAVFDVAPYRPRILADIGVPYYYYSGATVMRFLEAVLSVARQHGLAVVYKSKAGRDAANLAPGVAGWIRSAQRTGQAFVTADADLSARHVLAGAAAAISLPFTTPALIADRMGVPSVYFDPTGDLHDTDRIAHGLPMLNRRSDLARWLCTALNPPSPSSEHGRATGTE